MTDTILDMDSILDQTLDTVPDIPDYVTPPTGLYMLSIEEAKLEKYNTKDKKAGLRLKVVHKIEETVETEEMPVADGSLFSETFQATEEGLGYFKRAAKKYLGVESLDGVSIRDIIAELTQAAPFKARITIRKTPNPAGGMYENVQIRPVLEEGAAE